MQKSVDGPHVGADILLREHDPFGIAGGARREDHREHIRGLDAVEPQQPIQQAQWRDGGMEKRTRLIENSELAPERGGIQQRATEGETDTVEECRA